jgi:long-chain acyl-CoA synthetase
VALICENQKLTFGELGAMVDSAATQIEAAGVLDKDRGATRIGLNCPNGLAHVVLALAVVRSGGCLVPIASELSTREREALAASLGLDTILVADGATWSQPATRELPLELPSFRAGILAGLPSANHSLVFDEDALAALNPAFIRFSSGTTGRSKGVVLSHKSLFERVTAANERLQIGPKDRVIWILPMAHHFAVSIMLYLLHGATTVVVNSHLAEDILSAGIEHGGTVLYGSPFHHAMLAGEPSGRAWPTLRLAVSTAAALTLQTAQAFQARYGLPLSQGLGIIEVGLPFLNANADKPTHVGLPMPAFEVQLRAIADNGKSAGDVIAHWGPNPAENRSSGGDVGEIFVRGPGMLDAYVIPWRRRDEILKEGWFRTGDLGVLDEEGSLQLVGRSHSVINVAGLKCFPEEIEAILCEHPGVLAARVSGKAHDRVGAIPVAEIVPRDSSAPPSILSLNTHCRRALSRYKVPVEFKMVERLPKTASGKLKR